MRVRVALSLRLRRSREELRSRRSRVVALVGESSSEGVLEGSGRVGKRKKGRRGEERRGISQRTRCDETEKRKDRGVLLTEYAKQQH